MMPATTKITVVIPNLPQDLPATFRIMLETVLTTSPP